MLQRLLYLLLPLSLLACASAPPETDPFDPFVWEKRERPPEEDPAALFLLGRWHEDAGRTDEAILDYRRALEKDPAAAEILARLAGLYLERGDFEEAGRSALAAIDVDPMREDALSVLARAYLEMGRTEEVIERFEKMTEKEEDGRIRFLLSTLYQSRGDSERALAELERAASLSPDRPFYHFRLGEAYQRRKRFEEAERSYRKALSLAENDRPIRQALGRLYLDWEHWKEAAETYESFLRENFRPLEAHHRLIGIYLRLGRNEDALRHAKALRDSDPENTELRSEIAELFLSLGHYEEGVAELEEVWKEAPADLAPARRLVETHIEHERFAEAQDVLARILALRPEDAWAWARLAYAKLRLGDAAASREALERSVALDPENGGTLFLLGNSYLAAGRLPEALDLFARAYDRGNRSTDLLFRKASLESQLGREEDAVRTLRELLAKENDHAPAMNLLGYLLAERGRDLDEAERLVGRALELRPENPFYRDSLGWVYFKKGDAARAVRELEEAHAARREDPTILEHLADAYAAAGRREDAIRSYREVLRLKGDAEEAREKLMGLERP